MDDRNRVRAMPPLLLAAAGAAVVETLSTDAGADEAPDMKVIAGVALANGLPPPSALGLPFDDDGEADGDEFAVPLSCAARFRLS